MQFIKLNATCRLFNFAIGLFIPAAFQNITWKLFIIFGVLCFAAAVQAWLTYPETCNKSLEEIEVLFQDGAPKPWTTKPGDSLLDQKIAAGDGRKDGGVTEGSGEQRMEYTEKVTV